eukprot:1069636-Prymnesium_polylepis.1
MRRMHTRRAPPAAASPRACDRARPAPAATGTRSAARRAPPAVSSTATLADGRRGPAHRAGVWGGGKVRNGRRRTMRTRKGCRHNDANTRGVSAQRCRHAVGIATAMQTSPRAVPINRPRVAKTLARFELQSCFAVRAGAEVTWSTDRRRSSASSERRRRWASLRVMSMEEGSRSKTLMTIDRSKEPWETTAHTWRVSVGVL